MKVTRRTRRTVSALLTLAALPIAAAAALVPGVVTPSAALDNGVALTPPMGWNSWNAYGCDIDESKIKSAADSIVSSGLQSAGYEYVNLDDCWQASTRDADGNLRPDPTRFPSGMKALADYVHAKGLKLGIYATPGTRTCANIWNGYPGTLGSKGHEQQDATTFASWGVDYLKYDWCRADEDGVDAQSAFTLMRNALKATGRPIVFSIHREPQLPMEAWRPEVANSWRTTADIRANWNSLTTILDSQDGLEVYSRPGAWNDPDMLQVGNGSLTDAENRMHFSLWALLSAPLLAGNQLATMSDATKQILTNRDVIAVDQDWGGSQGRRIRDDGDREVWAKPMSDGSVAVVLLNRTDAAADLATTAAEVGLGGSSSYSLKNLWTGVTSTSAGAIAATVAAHDVAMFRVTRAGSLQAAPAAGTYKVGDMPWLASTNGWGPAERNLSNGESGSGDGRTLTINGTTYAKGIGVHAGSGIQVYLGGACSAFTAQVGVDDEVSDPAASVRFQVYGDGRLLAYSDIKTAADGATTMTVPTAGFTTLELRASGAGDGNSYDHADWGDATLTCAGAGTGSFVSDRSWSSATNGWGPVERNRSNGENAAGDGIVEAVGGIHYTAGVGAHAKSDVAVPLGGSCHRFTAVAGVDAEVTSSQASVVFSVVADGVTLYTSPVLKAGQSTPIDVDVTGRSDLHLVVGDAGDSNWFDHADWAGARLSC